MGFNGVGDVAPTDRCTPMVVVIFRSRLRDVEDTEYAAWAARMSDSARESPGYISHKGYTAEDGERVTIVEFEDEATMRAWGRHPEHVAAKRLGRERFYLSYRIQICTPLRETRFPE